MIVQPVFAVETVLFFEEQAVQNSLAVPFYISVSYPSASFPKCFRSFASIAFNFRCSAKRDIPYSWLITATGTSLT